MLERVLPQGRIASAGGVVLDHTPLLLLLDDNFHPKRRFCFQAYLLQFEGYLKTVESAWNGPRPDMDTLRTVDHLLRETAKAMQQ